MLLNLRPISHPMYTESDYAYFSCKGYTDAEIVAFWDRDMARGCEPLVHKKAPDVVGYLNQK